jgi:hypothetical protein
MLDFANSGRLDPRVTFTRASTATYFDATGTLQSAANDVPRFDYDPATLAAQGLLIEESRTNSIRNNTMVGAVAGTPGTLPTNWVVNNTGGLTTNVIGVGTSAGINYVDLQVVGTSTGTLYQLAFDANTQISASAGQSWAGSFWVAQTAGTTGGVTATNVRITSRDSGGATIGTNDSADITLTGTLARYASVYASMPASTAFVQGQLRLGLTSGAAIDITLRIGLPQLELGAFATSVIPTTTTALTRAADVASVNTLSPWFNATEGTIYAESLVFSITNQRIASFNDGSTSNRIIISRGTASGGNVNGNVSAGGSPQVSGLIFGTSLPAETFTKTAFACKLDDFAGSVNGSAAVTDTSGTIPTVNILALGSGEVLGANSLNGYLRRITYYNTRLPNAQLQALTAP